MLTWSDAVVADAAPRLGLLVAELVGFQLVLVGVYVWYKRRRSRASKKFL